MIVVRDAPEPLRITIGASELQRYPGWMHTTQAELDLLRRADWEALCADRPVSAILMEHVWEHLGWDEALVAARMCYDFLAPGGYVRCAVPDGYFPDAAYQQMAQVGGPGIPGHPAENHQIVYTYRTFPVPWQAAGFVVRFLEYCDEAGQFHFEDWDESDGFIYRSRRFDHRNQNGNLGFTSLIIDAMKPR